MNQRTIILVIVAFVVAALASFMMRGTVDEPTTAKVQVLVAIGNVSAGSFVRTDKDIAWKDWPEDNITPSMIVSTTDKIEDYNGAVARRSIMAGEAITRNTLVRSTEGGFLSAVLAPGTRAVSISVNATSGNAGFVFPGDRVDLILTHRVTVSQTGEGETATKKTVLASETFAENVRVVAVDQMLDNPENKAVLAKTVTLEVTPKQAEKINVAVDLGKISISLRSLGNTPGKEGAPTVTDANMNPVQPSNGETLTQDSDVSKLIDTKSDGRTSVKVIRGGATEQVDFLRE